MLRKVMTSMGRTVFQARVIRAARLPGKQEEIAREPEYAHYKSFEQIQNGTQNQKTPAWKVDDHLSATDEINHRGIEQRAKEWGIPCEKLEKLKPWEHHPTQSNTEAYKDTIFKGKEQQKPQGYHVGTTHGVQNLNQEVKAKGSKFNELASGTKKFFGTMKKDTGSKLNDLASGSKQSEGTSMASGRTQKIKADEKYTDKSCANDSKACSTDKQSGKCTTHNTGFTRHMNTNQEADRLPQDRNTAQGQAKNAQNSSDLYDQGMVDKAMSWVKEKFGGAAAQKEGPTGDHNASNKGYENHKDAVHKATFTEYQDSKKPFTSSVEDGQKKTEKTKDQLNQH